MKSFLLALVVIPIILLCGGIINVAPGGSALAQNPPSRLVQPPVQLTNEYGGTASSILYNFVEFKGETYFGTTEHYGSPRNSVGLWKTDATEEGTTMIKDVLLAGQNLHIGGPIATSSEYIFFSAHPLTVAEQIQQDAPFMPYQLWRSDGTSSGTISLQVQAGNSPFIVYQDVLYFRGDDEPTELWRSDGTLKGTYRVFDLEQRLGDHYAISNDLLYFTSFDSDRRYNIWQTDGASEGTKIAVDVAFDSGAAITELVTVNDSLFFTTYRQGLGGKLWRSDGTSTGTNIVVTNDIGPVESMAEVNGKLFYNLEMGPRYDADSELWVTDGTEGGNLQLIDEADSRTIRNITAAESYLYFNVTGRWQYPYAVWRSDGTKEGTFALDVAERFPYRHITLGDDLYFAADDRESGYELWRTAGITTETGLIKDIVPSILDFDGESYPAPLHSTDYGILFSANGGTVGTELWKSDGTADGTTLIKDINTTPLGVNFHEIKSAANLVYFVTQGNYEEEVQKSLWKSDGTVSGTEQIMDFAPNTSVQWSSHPFVTAGDKLYFSGDGELWVSNGTAEGTRPVGDLSVSHLVVINDALYFSKGNELWRTDGTTQGTRLVTQLPSSISSQSFIVADGLAYFFAYNPESDTDELWQSDGTEAGTALVEQTITDALRQRAYPAPYVSFTADILLRHNDVIYFSGAAPGAQQRELWHSDGTAEGTQVLKAGSSLSQTVSSPSGFVAISPPEGVDSAASTTMILFRALGDGSGLWRTDGTAEGTRLVREIALGGWNYFGAWRPFSVITSMGPYALFIANDGQHGRELWRSDGTESGTSLVADILPGSQRSDIDSLLRIGNHLYFVAADGVHGRELWRSDGTAAGTEMVNDLRPGKFGSNPSNLTYRDGMLYFSANDGANGIQLHALSVEAPTSLETVDEPIQQIESYLPIISTASK